MKTKIQEGWYWYAENDFPEVVHVLETCDGDIIVQTAGSGIHEPISNFKGKWGSRVVPADDEFKS